jgi:CheY-like chemotaxis protein
MAYDLSALRILVVDDNAHMHQIMRSILGAMRIKVHCVSDVDGAFDALANWHPDILIVDVMVGEDDGLDLIARVRNGERGANPYMPVIVLTGHTERRQITRARDVGVHEVLAKPVSIENLYKRFVQIVVNPRPFVRTKGYFGPCRRRQEKPYQGPERRGDENAEDMVPKVDELAKDIEDDSQGRAA